MSMSSKKDTTLYSGVRSEWPDFKMKIEAKLMSLRAYNIVFPKPNGTYEELEDRPERPGEDASTMQFNMWKYEDEQVRKFNIEYEKRESAALGAIQELLDPRLLDFILATRGDPRAAFDRLEEEYGFKAGDIHAISLQKQNFFKMKQKENELFSQFHVGFELQRIKAHCTVEDALALLTTRDKEQNPLQKRLHEDAQLCRKSEKTYEETVRFLSREDQSNLESGVFKNGVSARRVRRDEDETDGEPQEKTHRDPPAQVPTKPCPCCGNVGHAPRDCKLDACNWCKDWHCGHNSFNCPKRREEIRKKNPMPKRAKVAALLKTKTKRNLVRVSIPRGSVLVSELKSRTPVLRILTVLKLLSTRRTRRTRRKKSFKSDTSVPGVFLCGWLVSRSSSSPRDLNFS